ncbi:MULTISPECIES: hypothetical protein [unclassified Duganella]|uniref:hypothetical protein n=1 Tax=unclassified Duganella TaxID=2636909 RepID=UPI0006F258C7|nr:MULTISPECIES: hypothetical protein [unclassified Duganella]KQV54128.1 hypothetical protein ASD07_06205 [Duganella sp. Root336D2]KRB95582.1 hypothetical protein ASE26_26510 [Duganella sp. Root198D2]
MNAILALKLFLVPSLIYAVTLAGRRWGPAVAGWLSAFPIVAGPILLAISLEQGPGFAASAAEGTLLAVLAMITFSLAYAWASGRTGVAGAMPLALGAWALAVAGLQSVRLPLPFAALAVVAALLAAPRLFPPRAPAPAAPTAAQPVRRRSDLPWRMLAGAVLVMSVSAAAAGLGPRLSGFFAMFPVMGTVLVGFTHVQAGRDSAVQLLRGTMLGYFAFAAFCVAISLLLRAQAVAVSFFCAFVFALTIQLLAKAASSKRLAT